MTLNSAKENGPTWRKSYASAKATRVTCASLIGLLSLAHARQMYTEKKSDIELSCVCALAVHLQTHKVCAGGRRNYYNDERI
jgi:hypothetical protein